ncbi:replication protein A [Pseudoalteromonas luteoviolacea]|uniref:replication protein A n=1 Tax=Pseudoalteromonas luteoviolacea TaxID=43657 RepID=UPI00114DC12F|nr:replication protein A [Pseudoalteromonas luteoviolacea]TQF66180.1 replication protein A [Pseudoalteromonas luteoviolacea]
MKSVSLNNLPSSVRRDIEHIETAQQVQQLSLFVESKIANAGLRSSISNTFVGYDLWSRFIRHKREQVPVSAANNKVIISRKVSEKIDNVLYDGVLDISPALIKGKDADFLAWPSDREEKVERALIRLGAQGKIVKISGRVGERYAIVFTLRELQTELKSVSQTLSVSEIKESLMILKGAELSMRYREVDGDSESYSESSMNYISSIHFSGSSGKSTVKCIAFLNEVMSQQIEGLTYRSYYFDRVQSFKRSLSRWLALRLYQVFRYAATGKTYHFMLVNMSIKFGSITSEEEVADRLTAIRRDMTQTMKDFIESDIIESYTIENVKDNNGVIVDYKYEINPTEKFCAEVLNLNKQHRTRIAKAEAALEELTLGEQSEKL